MECDPTVKCENVELRKCWKSNGKGRKGCALLMNMN